MSKWRNRKTQCPIICQKNILSFLIICQKNIPSYLNICQKNILSYLNICQKNILSYLIICQRDGIDHRHLSLGLSRASYSAPASAVAEVHKIDYNQDMYTITYSDKKMDDKGNIPPKNLEIFIAFAIKRRTPPLKALISIHFLPHFFLLQLNLTYMKPILQLVPVKVIILKSSYNWFKY